MSEYKGSRVIYHMFSEEREMWKKFFDMFKKHFDEEVGLVPSVYESDDGELDIDFIVGEKTNTLFGVMVIQHVSDEEEDGEEEEIDDDGEDDDDEDDEDGEAGDYVYTFIKTDEKIEKIEDKKVLTIEFVNEYEEEADEHVHLDFYGTDEEFTALVVEIDDTNLGVFKEHKDFEF